MGRRKKTRVIHMAPHIAGFTPWGGKRKSTGRVIILFEEYEAINLCDYELLSQAEAAEVMGISRPTFTRIYETCRRKIARAMVEGCEIIFEEGNTYTGNWHECKSCGISFTITADVRPQCPVCKTGLTDYIDTHIA
ncbi:DUF134 domain-containing protein [Haoranjiania flava]|uniref:DUF134 domain-containing protein n=1 Tax=Haoranjiania flava TaxID=1856322 RepID=A0AAE3IKY4_9BACT|nr:DUF134 domain-containing protein [Haoranjiania flava]MCU7693693.1 DUF134 domain-containing protein [Haoranjiania flava]